MVAINSWKWKNSMMKNCSFVHQLKNDSYGLHERIERGHHGLR